MLKDAMHARALRIASYQHTETGYESWIWLDILRDEKVHILTTHHPILVETHFSHVLFRNKQACANLEEVDLSNRVPGEEMSC